MTIMHLNEITYYLFKIKRFCTLHVILTKAYPINVLFILGLLALIRTAAAFILFTITTYPGTNKHIFNTYLPKGLLHVSVIPKQATK